MPFSGVYGDYGSPWSSFVTNTSFFFMRNWVNIYWAISDSKGPYAALFILFMIIGCGTVSMLNLFIPVVLAFMKVSGKYAQRLIWLRAYPGDIYSVRFIMITIITKFSIL